jgi:hypothetical protein
MPRESGRSRTRRLAFLGLLLLIVPTSGTHPDDSACKTDNAVISLVCTPVVVVRILVPFTRFLLADARPAR